MKKRQKPSRPLLGHSGSGQETTLYLRVALGPHDMEGGGGLL